MNLNWITKQKFFLAMSIIAVTLIPLVKVSASEAKALEILRIQEKTNKGYKDQKAVGTMTLVSKSGKKSVREFTTILLEETKKHPDMSIIIFSSPKDIRGTSMLTHSKKEPENDDQWLYLPALKKVKRISSSNKSGKFVASEFSYEDLTMQKIEDGEHSYKETKKCAGNDSRKCYVIETKPKNKKSGYSKTIQHIDTRNHQVQYIEFYNRRGDLEKTLQFSDYKKYKGKFWRAHTMLMQNVKSGKSTILKWGSYRFGNGLSSNKFKPKDFYR